MLIAVFGDLDSADEFHDEIGATGVGCPCIKHLGDVGMVHQRHRLSLGLKACDHAFGVHSRLDNLQRDPPPNWLLLFCHVNHAASALTDLSEQPVMANTVARFLSRRKQLNCFCRSVRSGSAKEIASLCVRLQQSLDSAAESVVSPASLAQIAIALLKWKAQSFREDGNIPVRSTVHFRNRVFRYSAVEFNLRTADVRPRLRRVLSTTPCNITHAYPKKSAYNR